MVKKVFAEIGRAADRVLRLMRLRAPVPRVRPSVAAIARNSGAHSESSARVLGGQCAGTQSPAGSVVCPTSIR